MELTERLIALQNLLKNSLTRECFNIAVEKLASGSANKDALMAFLNDTFGNDIDITSFDVILMIAEVLNEIADDDKILTKHKSDNLNEADLNKKIEEIVYNPLKSFFAVEDFNTEIVAPYSNIDDLKRDLQIAILDNITNSELKEKVLYALNSPSDLTQDFSFGCNEFDALMYYVSMLNQRGAKKDVFKIYPGYQEKNINAISVLYNRLIEKSKQQFEKIGIYNDADVFSDTILAQKKDAETVMDSFATMRMDTLIEARIKGKQELENYIAYLAKQHGISLPVEEQKEPNNSEISIKNNQKSEVIKADPVIHESSESKTVNNVSNQEPNVEQNIEAESQQTVEEETPIQDEENVEEPSKETFTYE